MKLNLLNHISYVLICTIFINGISFTNAHAQNYPPEQNIANINWDAYQAPTSVPNYLQSNTESLSGNEVIRISDENVFGCNCSQLRHRYVKNRPWNADETKIMTSGSPSKILDATTYEVIDEISVKSLWSNVDPDLTYDTAANSTFVSKNVVTGQTITLHQFSQFSSVSVGYSEGNLSNDDRWVALIGINGSNKTLLVYDIENDVIVGEWFKGTTGIDWVSMSQSGNYVVVSYTNEGTGSDRGIKSYDQNFNNERHLVSGHPHGDLGYDSTGNEVFVAYGNAPSGYSLSYSRLDTGQTFGLFPYSGATGDKGLYGGHVSCRNIDRPGWAYITEQGHPSSVNNNEATREIFAVKIDNSGTIERYAKHNTVTSSYYHQAHAVPNKDGTKVIFVSNWDDSYLESRSYAPMFVVEVPQNGTATVNAGNNQTICLGESANLSASGVQSYIWNTGQTTANITVTPNVTTTYSVTGTDTGGNTSTDSVTVTVTPLPNASAGIDTSICAGESTILTASGGSSFLWNTGQTTPSITVSPNTNTTYSVTVTQNGCDATDSVFVNVIATPNANAGNDVSILNGENVTLTATGGGTYLWSNGQTSQSITVSPNQTTLYTVTAYMLGCEDTDEILVTVNEPVNADAGPDVTICEGESTTLTASGGVNYLWSTGETTQSISVNPNASTTYTVTVTNGNISDSDNVTVFVNPLPTANAGNDVTINIGESTTLTASGGQTYLWSTGQTTASIVVSPTINTTYTVTAFQNGCQSDDSVNVVVNGTTVIADAGPDVTICEGESTTLTAFGGDSYVWSSGQTTQSITVSPNSTTTYTVTASVGVNSDTDSVTVFVNPMPSANAGNNVSIINGESTTLTASGGGSYLWDTGQTTQSITVSPNQTTLYLVTVNLNGCEDTDSVIVTVNEPVVADAGPDVTICEGESTTLTASGGNTYLWNTGATTQSITVNPNSTITYTVTATVGGVSDTDNVTVTVNPLPNANAGNDISITTGESTTLAAFGGGSYLWNTGQTTQSIIVNPIESTLYSVTVTLNGCEAIDYVLVTVNEPVFADAGSDATICQGEGTTLTASGGDTYQWSTGQTTQSIYVSPNSSTTYTVTATIGNSSDTDSVTVFVNPLPNANAGNDVSIINGESTTLTATGGGTYLWSTNETTQSITVSPTQTTTYTVTVSLNSCEDSDDIVVNVDEAITAYAGPDTEICIGEATTLTASGGDTYLWNTGETTQSITVNPTVTTVYSVVVSIGPISDSDDVVVYVNPLPSANAGNDEFITNGESITLTASGGDTYLWNTGETTASITVSPPSDTTYTVTAFENGCEADDSVTVFVSSGVFANAGPDVTICENSSTVLTASGGDSYEWNTGETTQSITVNPNATTTYTVIAYVGNDFDTDDVTVFIDPGPIADAGPDIAVCVGETLFLTANGGETYLWNTGETSQSILVEPEETTTYSVLVTQNGCEDTDDVTVTIGSYPTADAGPNQNISGGESAVLTASGEGTYLWSTGETTQSITVSPLATTHYTLTVNNNGCEDSDTVVVSVNGQVTAYAGEDVTICQGDSTTLTVFGGNVWTWSTGETTQSITVSPGSTTTYSVTVSQGQGQGNSDSDEVTVFVDYPPLADAGNDVSICEGDSVILTAAGGDSYLWNTGETTESITVSPNIDTIYSVLVTQYGCQAVDDVLVTVNPPIVADAGNDVTICQGDSRVLTASGGNSFLWSTGETTQSITVSPTADTAYNVTVYQDGCEDSDIVTVFVNQGVEANAGEDSSICQGESITLTASGGDSYLWSSGETTQSITVNPTDTTTYFVTAYQGSCSGIDDITITVNPIPSAYAGDDVSICEGESITLNASGGDTYLWNTGENSQSITVSPNTSTTYSVVVNSNNCESSDDVTVTVNPIPNADAGNDQNITSGESATLTATGGDIYLWSTGENTQSIIVSPTETTSYMVTVDSNGCQSNDSVLVIVDGEVTANAGEDVTICEGESTILLASGGDSFEWSTGETSESITVNPSITTTYSVTVYLGANSAADEVTVFVNPIPAADAGNDVAICEGESTVLTASGGDSYEWNTGETTASITVSPGTDTQYSVIVGQNGCEAVDDLMVFVNPQVTAFAGEDISICEGETRVLTASGGDTFQWSSGETTQSITVSPNETTTYTVTVSQDGCQDTDEITITVNAFPGADAGSDVSLCEGESTTLTASGGGTYEWSTGETTQTITVSPNSTTDYYVTVLQNGCQATDAVTVTVGSIPAANAGDDITICEGLSTQLTANGGDSYTWNTGEITQSITVSPTSTTTYSVIVSQNGCEATDDVVVNVTPSPVADAGPDQNISVGESVTLTASDGGDLYLWSTGESTQSITVSPTTTTLYAVVVSTNSCEDTDTVFVIVDGEVIADAGEDVTLCEGDSTTLTASGGNTFQWSTGETTQSITVNPTTTTTYNVTVSQDGDSDTDEVTVFVNSVPVADAGNDQSICEGDSATLTASGGDTFQWSTGETTQNIVVNPQSTTTYMLTVFENGCQSTDEITVNVNTAPIADAGEDVTINQGESTILTASGGDTYQWSTGELTQSIEVSPSETTVYTVSVNSNGCEDFDQVTVTVNQNSEAVANAGEDVTICEGDSTVLTATGGTDYEWSTGEITQSITVSPDLTTNYSVVVSNATSSDTDTVTVFVNPIPIAYAGEDVIINQGESTILTATGGDSYTWSTGESTQSITVSPTETTIYTVFVSLNGCEDFADVTVTVNAEANANAGEDVSICQGDSTTLTATGGTDYLWSTGETTQSITVSPTATSNYTVIVSNDISSDTDDVTVVVNPMPNVEVSGDISMLEGEFVTLSATGADSYEWNNGATDPNIAVSPTETTTYFVTGYSNNCSETEDVTVTVFETVTADAGQDVTICSGESITLTANGGDSYLWNNGETTQSIEVSPDDDTMYTVIVSNELDSDADEVMVVVEACETDELPIEPTNFEYDIFLDGFDPNIVVIRVSGLLNDSELFIHDVAGRLLYEQAVQHNNGLQQEIRVNKNAYSQGVHIITMKELSVITSRQVLFR